MTNKTRKILAIILAVIMAASATGISVLAALKTPAEIQTENQIGSKYYQLGSSDPEKAYSSSDVSLENGRVQMKKDIAATGTENEFEITLQITTSEKLEELSVSPDAATVLVLDVSNSMNSNNNGRLASAKQAAKDFLDTYAAVTGDAERMISVVEFGQHAKTLYGWHSAVGTENLQAAKNAVDSASIGYSITCGDPGAHTIQKSFLEQKNVEKNYLKWDNRRQEWRCEYRGCRRTDEHTHTVTDWVCTYEGCTEDTNSREFDRHTHGVSCDGTETFQDSGATNIQAGVWLAKNLVNQLKTDADYADIANVNIILLTDGGPTQNSGDLADNTSTNYIAGTGGGASHVSKDDYDGAVSAATAARGAATVHTIFFGPSNYSFADVGRDSYSSGTKVTDFLKNNIASGNCNYTAGDYNALKLAFQNINSTITMLSEAWTVTDPMGDYIDFVEFTDTGTRVTDGVISTSAAGGKTSITWNVKKDKPVPALTETSGGVTYYTYQLKYKIRLNNTGSGFESGKLYNTNGTTTLEYVVTDADGNLPVTASIGYFKVPQVKGYLADLKFAKQDALGNPLGGAQFKLTNGSWTKTVYSDNTEANKGAVSFAGIPSGSAYSLSEISAPSGGFAASTATAAVTVAYGEVTVNGDLVENGVVTNYYDPMTIDIPVTKTWSDTGSHAEVTVTLMKKVGTAEAVTDGMMALNSANNWTGTFQDKPTKDTVTGVDISYTVVETAMNGYTPSYGGTMADGLTIHNVRSGKTDVSITKNWIVPSDYNLPSSIEVELYRESTNVRKTLVDTITLASTNDWTWSGNTLDRFDAYGAEYTYSVVEKTVLDSFDSAVSSNGNAFTITNTIKNSNTSLTVSKVWNDAALSSSRPAEITVNILKNGSFYKAVTLNSPNWSATETSLPVYDIDAANKTITANSYTVEEVSPDGAYVSEVTGGKGVDGTYTYTVTNSIEGTVSISGEKIWEDDNNAENTRPDSITITLYRSSATVSEQTVDSVTLTKEVPQVSNPDYSEEDKAAAEAAGETYNVPEQIDGDPVWPTTYSFGARDKYDAAGNEYTYYVRESGQGNDYTPGYPQGTYSVTNTLNADAQDITVTKIWVDNGNAYSTRPSSLTIYLYGDDGKTYSETISDTSADSTEVIFKDVPVYANGKRITYAIGEGSEAANYDATISQQGLTIINTLKPGSRTVSGAKIWIDGGNVQNQRTGVTLQLCADNVAVSGKTVTLTASDADASGNWAYTFEGLPQYKDGKLINYTIQETNIPEGYAASYSEDGLSVTNTLQNPEISLSVSKLWVDGGGTRPDSITVQLYADDVAVSGKTVTLNANNGWSGIFTGLAIYDASYNTIAYTVKEVGGESGKVTYNGKSYDVSITQNSNGGYTIQNTLSQESLDINVSKNWVGPANERPGSITVGLYRNGTRINTLTLSANADTTKNWKGSFAGLDKYDANRNTYTYSVRELDADGDPIDKNGTFTCEGETYTVTYGGPYDATITNTVTQGEVDVYVTKNWENITSGYGYEADYPSSITVQLYADGAVSGSPVALSPVNGVWSHTFENLPEFAINGNGDGHRITYTVKEGTVNGEGQFVAAENDATILYGDDTFTVTYGRNTSETDDFAYGITNTYSVPMNYYYKVICDYYTVTNGVSRQDGTAESNVISVAAAGTQTVNTGDYTNFESKSYTFKSGTPSVEIVDANTVYEMHLVYERTVNKSTSSSRNALIVNWVGVNDDGTTVELRASTSERMRDGASFDKTEALDATFTGWAYRDYEVTGVGISGRLTMDTEITVYYTTETEIEPEDPPLDPGTTENPENPEDPGEIDIPDDDVPLDDSPKTSENAALLTFLWFSLVISFCGLVILMTPKFISWQKRSK